LGIVLTLRANRQTVQQLSERLGGSDIEFESIDQPDQLYKRAAEQSDGVEAVLIGATCEKPLWIAQRVTMADKELGVLILCQPKRIESLTNFIRISPFLGPDVKCVSTNDTQSMAETLRTALGQTRQR
jgi:hypothetical protein